MASNVSRHPVHWEADVVLRDGGVVHIRPIRPSDAEGLQRFHARQSEESIYLRFFAPLDRLSDRELTRFTVVDHDARVGLVATLGDDIVGIARYDRLPADATGEQVAEVAFNISDAHQGRGVGSVMLEHLVSAARERGIQRFVAEVLPENRRMIDVFEQAGYSVTQHDDDGVLFVGFEIAPTERADRVRESREQRAEARSMWGLLHPTSVVVIGRGGPRSPARLAWEHLVAGGFPGRMFMVNADERADRVRRFNRVADIPGPVDVAVLALHPQEMSDDGSLIDAMVRDCAAVRVRGLVIIGDDEPDGDATFTSDEWQRHLVQSARAYGMRVVGPRSFGMIVTNPGVQFNASLAPTMPRPGRLGLFGQSGVLGVALLAEATRRGLGISTFLSAGNRADVSGNDLMQYWSDDPETAVACLHLESVGNPRKFSRIAGRLARIKPVLVMKAGQAGFVVPPGHAVRRSTLPRQAFDALLRQAGVIQCKTVHDLFDVAQLVVHQPLPAGPRVAVVTNSGSLGALAADSCTRWGLSVLHGPVTVPGRPDAQRFRAAVDAAFASPEIDSVVAAFIPPSGLVEHSVAVALAEAAARAGKTCVATFFGIQGVTAELSHPRVESNGDIATQTVPAYDTVEESVRSLAAVTRYAQWVNRPLSPWAAAPGAQPLRARELMSRWLNEPAEFPTASETLTGEAGRWLTHEQATTLLATYGIEIAPAHLVRTADEAVSAAAEVGYPVALKAADPQLRHRADLAAIRLDIAHEGELRDDVAALLVLLRGQAENRLIVQSMAVGVSCQVRSVEDPLFGPVVEFGVAGPATDLLDDVARRSVPVRQADVTDLVREVRAAPLLFGYRGAEPVDIGALEDIISRLAVFAGDLPEAVDVVLDPVVAGPSGVVVLGARMRIAWPMSRTDGPSRRLLR
ncbi:MAG: GNAT family N-acetyltransferase [Actinomycetota bacterium]